MVGETASFLLKTVFSLSGYAGLLVLSAFLWEHNLLIAILFLAAAVPVVMLNVIFTLRWVYFHLRTFRDRETLGDTPTQQRPDKPT